MKNFISSHLVSQVISKKLKVLEVYKVLINDESILEIEVANSMHRSKSEDFMYLNL